MRKLRGFWSNYDLDVFVVLPVLLVFLRPGLVASIFQSHRSINMEIQHGRRLTHNDRKHCWRNIDTAAVACLLSFSPLAHDVRFRSIADGARV